MLLILTITHLLTQEPLENPGNLTHLLMNWLILSFFLISQHLRKHFLNHYLNDLTNDLLIYSLIHLILDSKFTLDLIHMSNKSFT